MRGDSEPCAFFRFAEKKGRSDVHVSVATVLLEARLGEVQRHESDVRVVHRLQFLSFDASRKISMRQQRGRRPDASMLLTIPSSVQSKLASVTSSLTAERQQREKRVRSSRHERDACGIAKN